MLTWPTGASRPAFFHFVTTSERLALIKTTQGSTTSLQPLVFFDGRAGKTITASMYMLPERPLNQLGHDGSDAWLVTLTDVRFYWYWRRGVITSPSSWTNLFSQIGTVLGTSITVDTVDPRYGTPSAKWNLPYAPTPVLLDSAAAQVGQRVVVGLNGAVRTVNWESARTDSDSYVAAGPAVVSGGLATEAGIARYVPAAVKVLFVDTSTTPPSSSPHVETKTLVALAVPEYGAAPGVAGYYQTLNADTPYTGSNATAVSDYAVAAAEDWYGWRLSDVDTVYPGTEPWVPTGWEDFVEWTLQKRDPTPYASTLVRRGPWNDFISGDWFAGEGGTGPDPFNPCGGGLVPGCVPSVGGSGSGSGSGSGHGPGYCDDLIETVTVDCAPGGSRTLTSKFIDLASENGRMKIVSCTEENYDLGPCSPTNPQGTTIPVTLKTCPVFTEIRYLDWDSQPQSVRVVTGIVTERRLVVVAVADVQGCVDDPDDCCTGSGSGSGGELACFFDCDQCVDGDGMSTIWTLVVGTTEVTMYRVENPDDGNYCRFYSLDLVWDVRYDYAEGVWALTKNIGTEEEEIWVVDGALFDCHEENVFTPADLSQGSAFFTPELPCTSVSYNCVSGSCVEVIGTGGTYPTLEACEAVCVPPPITTTCCANALPQTLYLHFSGSTGTCGFLDGITVTITWDGVDRWAGNGPDGSVWQMPCVSFVDTWRLSASGTCGGSSIGTTNSCLPLNVTGTLNLAAGCCTGTINWLFNATP